MTAAWAGLGSTAGTGTEEGAGQVAELGAGQGAGLGAGQGATWQEDRRVTHRDISSTSEVGRIT